MVHGWRYTVHGEIMPDSPFTVYRVPPTVFKMELGEYNTLEVLRDAEHGYYLGDEEGNDVLIPMKWVPDDIEIGGTLEVFVYKDSYDRPIATTMTPLGTVGDFVAAKVKQVTKAGAFVDWGLEKDLLIPYKEQPMERLVEGQEVLVFIYLDEVTDRIAATTRLHLVLENEELDIKEGDEVEIKIWKKTDLGYSVAVNDEFLALLPHLEVFQEIKIGETRNAFVKRIKKGKDGNLIDVSLRKFVGEMVEPDAQLILDRLKKEGGFMPFNDKSSPEEIKANFKMSKKAFKRAVGNLYKKRLIKLGNHGIRLA